MIKVKTFCSHLYGDVDEEMEKFINDEEIRYQQIIKIQFYSAVCPEDNYLYHYGKLVYWTISKNIEILRA